MYSYVDITVTCRVVNVTVTCTVVGTSLLHVEFCECHCYM